MIQVPSDTALPPPPSGISYVQGNSATATSGSSITIAYTNGQIAGDLNVVAVMTGDTTSSISSVTDSNSNTYTRAVGPTTITGLQQSIYYAKNIHGGSNTVTVKFTQTASYPNVNVTEYNGLDTSNPLDVSAAASGSGTGASSGSATTTSVNELIVGAGNPSGLFTAPGAGFSNRIINPYGGISEDQIVNGAAAYAATATDNGGIWVMQMVAFRGSLQSSSSPPAPGSISPTSGPTSGGTPVTISGTNFASGATVTFGATAATSVVVVSSAEITATTPAETAGTVNVVVTNSNGQNGTLTNGYTYTASPAPTSISPTSGTTSGGTPVTISGTNFASGATVTFGATAATNVVVVSSTTITATTPAHAAGAVNVVVTNSNGQSGTLTNGYTYTSSGTITFVQAASGPSSIQATNTSVVTAYLHPQTAGNLNIVAVGWADTTSSISSVVDSKGNIYTRAVGPTTNTGVQQSIYYAKNIAGGANKVKVTFNQAAAYPDVRILEYSGLDPTSPLDVTAAAAGSGTNASSGSATTTSANELIFGAGATAHHFTAAGSGFTKRLLNMYGNIAEDEVVSSTGSNAATATNSAGAWVMQMATFKAHP